MRTLKPDAIILDIMLPGIDGWEVCRRVRQGKRHSHHYADRPATRMSTRSLGWNWGADDYLTKPFNPRELVAPRPGHLSPGEPGTQNATPDRWRSQNRSGPPGSPDRRRSHHLAHQGIRSAGYVRPVPRGSSLTRERLLEVAWGYDFAGETRTVDVHVAHLRKKLAAARTQIATVSGCGLQAGRLTALSRGGRDHVVTLAFDPNRTLPVILITFGHYWREPSYIFCAGCSARSSLPAWEMHWYPWPFRRAPCLPRV